MNVLRVLVIDDSLTIRATLEEILQKGGRCRVVGSASSVEEARVMIPALQPDVITLDLALPGADGMTFLDEMSAPLHAPAVVVSSSTGPDAEKTREAMARGAAACFDKSRVVAEGHRLLRAVQMAALDHLRERVAGLERELRLNGVRA
jgi:two-component system chemotaxis response regulator CheB